MLERWPQNQCREQHLIQTKNVQKLTVWTKKVQGDIDNDSGRLTVDTRVNMATVEAQSHLIGRRQFCVNQEMQKCNLDVPIPEQTITSFTGPPKSTAPSLHQVAVCR